MALMSASPLRELHPEPRENGGDSLIDRSRWSIVAGRTVYFGHQSVGSGVVAGVEGVTQEHALPLRVVQTREPATVTGPAFVHFLAGQNRDYASKNAAVLRLLESRTRAQRPVVLLKYCYVDINSPTDPGTMFEAYCDTVDTIQSEHPDVTVVHATIPLTTVESAFKSGARQFSVVQRSVKARSRGTATTSLCVPNSRAPSPSSISRKSKQRSLTVGLRDSLLAGA